ncbi:hypothetical protein K0B96_06130 [Horticoccus luteus]|uniref:DUF4398 domain-containing protein n=1 Tax=Horticoccus luteus TaxID=2862869 RepID=A0A8F9TW50_9BACT|nr:hypothetical protein [Horticoccus luteus]QYM80190.1 hypothetical protein K0B96_06130 [Horticoccus luteus]
MTKLLGILTLAFTAMAYAGDASNSPAVAANLTAGAQAANTALAQAGTLQAKDEAKTRRAGTRMAYERAAAAEQAFRREQFAQLAKTTNPEKRAALMAAIEARWTARQSELAAMKADAEAEQPAPAVVTKPEKSVW